MTFLAKDLGKWLREVLEAPDYKPPVLPMVALKLHELTQSSDVDFSKVLNLLEQDSLLAAKVLKVAQSAAYATQVPVQSLRGAVQRLGLSNMRDIVWEVAMGVRVFRAKGYESAMGSIQLHSTATAHIARMLADRTSLSTEYAFLCGLLHDVGYAAMLIVVSEHAKGGALPAFDSAVRELDQFHEEASGLVCRIWNLPKDVQLVVSNHHHPRMQGFDHPLATLVCVAEALATDLGFDISLGTEEEPDISQDQVYSHALSVLGLDAKGLEKFRQDAEKKLLEALTKNAPA